jgi:hypothetical protein
VVPSLLLILIFEMRMWMENVRNCVSFDIFFKAAYFGTASLFSSTITRNSLRKSNFWEKTKFGLNVQFAEPESYQDEPASQYQSVSRKIQRKYLKSVVLPSFVFFGSVSRSTKGIRKYRVATYFERVKGPPFLFLPSSYLPTYYKGT